MQSAAMELKDNSSFLGMAWIGTRCEVFTGALSWHTGQDVQWFWIRSSISGNQKLSLIRWFWPPYDQRTGLRGPTPTLFRFYFLVDIVAQFDVRQSGLVCIIIYLSKRICCCASSPFQNMASARAFLLLKRKGVC